MAHLATQPTLQSLRTVFENLIINWNADVNWPPRSCDLTWLDYFLWGTVKDECYANQPETIQELKHEIKVAIDEIRAHTVENVLKNWVDSIVQLAVEVIWMKLYFMFNGNVLPFQ